MTVLAEEELYYAYTVINGKAQIDYYDGYYIDIDNIIIPDTLGGYPVTRINDSAFLFCEDILSITIPDSVTSIGDNAFRGCTNLAKLAIPDSVTEIGDRAFEGCNNLFIYCVEGYAAHRAAVRQSVPYIFYIPVDPGGATGDGNINLADVTLMLKHITKWGVEMDTDAANVNCDGNINLADVSLLLKYIAKWDVVLGKAE